MEAESALSKDLTGEKRPREADSGAEFSSSERHFFFPVPHLFLLFINFIAAADSGQGGTFSALRARQV